MNAENPKSAPFEIPDDLSEKGKLVFAWHLKNPWAYIFPLKDGTKGSEPDPSAAGKNRSTHYLSNGYKGASNQRHVILGWLRQWPNANWGLNLAMSGRVAVDVDSYKDDCEFDAMAAAMGGLPETQKQRSARGGTHYVFTTEPGDSFPNAPCRGVDIKHKGYIMIWPSTFEGGEYVWTDERPAKRRPDWLLQAGSWKKTGAVGARRTGRSKGRPAGGITTKLRSDLLDALRSGDDGMHDAGLKAVASLLTLGFHPDDVMATVADAIRDGCGTDISRAERHCGAIPEWIDSWQRKHPNTTAHVPGIARTPTGVPIWHVKNAMQVLRVHPDWRGVLAYEKFAEEKILKKPVPGSKIGGAYPRPLQDVDYILALEWFNAYFPDATKAIVVDAMTAVALENAFDPALDYFGGLQWDGVKRLDRVAVDYLGAEDNELNREIMKRWLISVVARVFQPGCKSDALPVLEGSQGAGKSSWARIMAVKPEWFSDGLPALDHKDASQHLRGKLIVEMSELAALSRKEAEVTKAFVSRQQEVYRPPFGREEVRQPRRSSFIGTTNPTDYHRDYTGGRRFWPVEVGIIDLVAVARDRDQIYAEAKLAYFAGERWDLPAHLRKAQAEAIMERLPEDIEAPRVVQFLRSRKETCVKEIVVSLSMDCKPRDQRIPNILKQLGWKRDGRFASGPYKSSTRYHAPEDWEADPEAWSDPI